MSVFTTINGAIVSPFWEDAKIAITIKSDERLSIAEIFSQLKNVGIDPLVFTLESVDRVYED